MLLQVTRGTCTARHKVKNRVLLPSELCPSGSILNRIENPISFPSGTASLLSWLSFHSCSAREASSFLFVSPQDTVAFYACLSCLCTLINHGQGWHCSLTAPGQARTMARQKAKLEVPIPSQTVLSAVFALLHQGQWISLGSIIQQGLV